VKKEDARVAADLFGSDISKSLLDITLKKEADYVNLASVIYLKLKDADSRSYLVAFLNELNKKLADDITSEDIGNVQSKLTVLFNEKLKQEKGKDGKKKAKGPTVKVERPDTKYDRNAAFDMYQVEGVEGGDDYGGYNKIDDFM
jgi:hypothetical protein